MIKILDLRKKTGDSDRMLFMHELSKRNQLENESVNSQVKEIIANIKERQDEALLAYTLKFDGVAVTSKNLRVTQDEMEKAYEHASLKYIETIQKASGRIRKFHEMQVEKSWFYTGEDGEILGQMVRPLSVVGIYTPGGKASYPSSVLMNAIPAKVAGVEKIVMVTPPSKDGSIRPEVLIAAKEAGVDEIYKCGGAQAIAALAFGTGTVPKVDKIVGPGNIYVVTAKRMLYGYCDIDMIAGPSEITVLADFQAKAEYVAADLLSQAEHDELAAAICVTDSNELAIRLQNELENQLELLKRKDIARKSIDNYGMIVMVNNMMEAVDIANIIAPEHLELCTESPFDLLPYIKNAGAIFLGNYSSEPMGDYMAGPNHVLPTSGTARFFSPLGVYDFIKRSSVISLSKIALELLGEDVVYFANKEGLEAHAKAVAMRLKDV